MQENPPLKYITHCQVLYSETLVDLEIAAKDLLSNPTLAEGSTAEIYEALVSSALSEICNNASLILRRMTHIFKRGWPDFVAEINELALETGAIDTYRVTRSLLRAAKHANGQRLSRVIQQGAESILDSLTVDELDLELASSAFLGLATNIEALLSDLWLEKSETHISEQEEALLSRMGNLTLASDTA